MTSVESELGRVPFVCFGALAGSLQPKERIPSFGFTELSSRFCTSLSYREATEMMNRVFHRPDSDGVKVRTISDYIQRVGNEIITTERRASNTILETCGFDSKTGQVKENVTLPDEFLGKMDKNAHPAWKKKDIQGAIDEINEPRKNKILATAKEIHAKLRDEYPSTVYISIDHIGVTRQKDVRKGNAVRKTKYVQNCVAHIQQGNNTYSFTDVDTDSLFKAVLAFLLANDLLKNKLVFFTDGATDLKSKIASFFSFHPYQIILDWFHVRKRTYEILSMAVAGKKAKKRAVLADVLSFLWVGDITGASNYIKSLPSNDIKNAGSVQEFLTYLDKKTPDMTCYAIRQHFKLRISSNRVEKENDMLVASRQKHNGMAWTPRGSGALAAIEMIYRNKQASLWFRSKQILGLQMPISPVSLAA